MGEVTIIGVDLAKNVFQVHGAAADGSVLFRKKLSRPQFARFSRTKNAACMAGGEQWRSGGTDELPALGRLPRNGRQNRVGLRRVPRL